MKTLNDRSLPTGLTLEKPANNLASLVTSDALQRLSDVLISQWSNVDAFVPLRSYGIRPIDRALFFGPPGNGKTVAAQLIANRLECPLYRVCCEGLISSAFGATPANVGNVLDWLSRAGQAVVLWDECESLFPNRSASVQDSCTRELVSAMQIFWQRLDRWSTPQLFLLATNMIERLDPALISRIDLRLEFGPPTECQALDVLEYWAELLHEYGADDWAPMLRLDIARGNLPASFRDLWQGITTAVRQHVCSEAAK